MESTSKTRFQSVDEYIDTFPAKTQAALKKMRKTIKAAAPKAEEIISYNMPAYKLNGMLVYFAGYEKHIGFYAIPSGIKAFAKDLERYKVSKGTVQFPLSEPIPEDLVTRMVKYRVKENEEKAKGKEKKAKPENVFGNLSAPAQRALASAGIKTVKKLSSFTEKEIMGLHGMGPSSLPKIKALLKEHDLVFKKAK